MYIIFMIGIVGWLIYGIKIKKTPIIVWNAITFVLAFSVIGYKIIYG
jgi:MtN3 and saliva related transmembrane protein